MYHRHIPLRMLVLPIVLLLISCRPSPTADTPAQASVTYEVDITRPLDDAFYVTVSVKGLTAANNVYNIAATAPGTYQNLDFGRFVSEVKAFDAAGGPIAVEHTSTNRWTISDPSRLVRLTYKVDDTFDTPVDGEQPAPMSGSGIDSTYAAFNTFSVLGYFEGLQSIPVRMKVDYVPGWIIATALDTDDEGYYVAETYDRLADSPVLAGELTEATTKVGDMDVSVYVWTTDPNLTASNILGVASDVLSAGGDFAASSPVPYYKFLMVLLDGPTFQRYGLRSAGALEHSYSSFYVMPSAGAPPEQMRGTMAHEFMHILTPLNLHSEIIHTFNFATPVPSQHLWLYEGVTEWVSDVMQLRSKLMTPAEFFGQVSAKMRANAMFPNTMSMTEMAHKVYTPEGSREYGNIYQKGALTAMCLDFKLLELSGETKGLREVYLDMLERFGKTRPFPEESFFDVFTEATYPEIGQFFDDHVKANKPLPIVEYAEKLGFRYIPERPSENTTPTLGVHISVDSLQRLVVVGVTPEGEASGLKTGDVLLRMFDTDISLANARQVIGKLREMTIGDRYESVVIRDGGEMTITGITAQRMEQHVFEEMDTLTPAQQHFRQAWMENMVRSEK